MARKRMKKYFAVYKGTAKNIRLSGVGKIYIGKEFEVSEKIGLTLMNDPNFEVKTRYKYE